jgi:hypothetical protein
MHDPLTKVKKSLESAIAILQQADCELINACLGRGKVSSVWELAAAAQEHLREMDDQICRLPESLRQHRQ